MSVEIKGRMVSLEGMTRTLGGTEPSYYWATIQVSLTDAEHLRGADIVTITAPEGA